MTVAAHPIISTGFDAWLEDRAASDTGPTHRVAVELRFEIDVSVPPGTPDHDIGETLLAVISRFDRELSWSVSTTRWTGCSQMTCGWWALRRG